jgi:hypothetical protein
MKNGNEREAHESKYNYHSKIKLNKLAFQNNN